MKLNKVFLFIVLLFSFAIQASEVAINLNLEKAQKSYEKGDYKTAISLYESVINANKESASLYYNLGNAYFKNKDLGMAILYYEKAKKLNPKDDDILTNLKIASQRIEDKIDPAPELFLSTWKKYIIDLMSEGAWSTTVILLFLLSLLLIALYIISSSKKSKQLGFFGGITVFVFTIFSFIIAFYKYTEIKTVSHAIVIAPSVNANGSPFEKGTRIFVIHEGTKVKINEESADWTEITIANNNVGWVKSSSIKKI